jgi:hypothetical protein
MVKSDETEEEISAHVFEVQNIQILEHTINAVRSDSNGKTDIL